MIDILGNRTYRHLFFAQIVALVGTGLATVALGLLAYELAGQDAGAVLGTALAIKMVAYVLVAPLAGAYANRLPRRALLVALDVARLTVVLLLPWVNQVWQIYVLIFVLQSCSAAFTPSFQATIPEVLPEEDDYTKALSLSRLAYDLEPAESGLGGGLAGRSHLPRVVSGHCCRLSGVGPAGRFSGAAAGAGRTIENECPAQANQRGAYLSRHAAPARAAGPHPGRRGWQCDGDRQHGGDRS